MDGVEERIGDGELLGRFEDDLVRGEVQRARFGGMGRAERDGGDLVQKRYQSIARTDADLLTEDILMASIFGRTRLETNQEITFLFSYFSPCRSDAAMSAAWKESISLEETNKIRISLGLKPISSEPATAAADPDALAEKNYALKLQRQQEEAASVALKAKIDKIRNGRERNKRLTGLGLGAEDPHAAAVKAEQGATDTKAWIKQQKKRAKEQAIKREKEQAEADLRDQESVKEYTEKDLLGIKVSHEADDFEEGEEVVLTLKDSRILDEQGQSAYSSRRTQPF